MSSAAEPTRLGEYTLLEKLGQGGMATVYRGERVGEAGFKKKVALKRMLPQYRHERSLLERFAAEARTNARLDHPNLVQVVDFGTEPEPFLVMEFVEGVALAALLHRLHTRREQLEIAAACFIGAEAAQGLDYAHRRRDEEGKPLGIVHRDVSPQNILLSNEGAVKVSDFGLVKAADNVVQTGSGMPIGKLSYMAPEQADHAEIDARADVFSLGVVVWEMLTLRPMLPPNDPAKAMHLLRTSEFKPPSAYNPKVPPELDAVVMACLSRDPQKRTPSAQAVSMQLREILHSLAPGYGREQLARMLGWAFPERGWQLDEPHETAAQPSMQDRISAADAVQRVSAPPAAPGAPAVVITGKHAPVPAQQPAPRMRPAPPKTSSSSPWAWLLLFGGLGLAALMFLFFLFIVLASSGRDSDAAPPPQPGPVPVMQPGGAPGQPVWLLDANVPTARFYLGPRELGPAPVQLAQSDLDGDPLVVLAPGYHPSIFDNAELTRMLAVAQGRATLRLEPSSAPELVVYVQHQGPAVAHAPGRMEDTLGPVPGILLVPPTFGRAQTLLIIEEPDRRSHAVMLAGCEIDKVCTVDGSP